MKISGDAWRHEMSEVAAFSGELAQILLWTSFDMRMNGAWIESPLP